MPKTAPVLTSITQQNCEYANLPSYCFSMTTQVDRPQLIDAPSENDGETASGGGVLGNGFLGKSIELPPMYLGTTKHKTDKSGRNTAEIRNLMKNDPRNTSANIEFYKNMGYDTFDPLNHNFFAQNDLTGLYHKHSTNSMLETIGQHLTIDEQYASSSDSLQDIDFSKIPNLGTGISIADLPENILKQKSVFEDLKLSTASFERNLSLVTGKVGRSRKVNDDLTLKNSSTRNQLKKLMNQLNAELSQEVEVKKLEKESTWWFFGKKNQM